MCKTGNFRSSHQRCFLLKGVLWSFAKFTEKHLCQSLFFNKVAGIRPDTLWHRCFPMNFAKFLRTPFLENTSWRLLLKPVIHFFIYSIWLVWFFIFLDHDFRILKLHQMDGKYAPFIYFVSFLYWSSSILWSHNYFEQL